MSEKYVSFNYRKDPVSLGIISKDGWKKAIGIVVEIKGIEIVYIPINENTLIITDTITGLIHKRIKSPININSAEDIKNVTIPYSAMFATQLDIAGISKIRSEWGLKLKELEKKYGSKPPTIWLTKEIFELLKKNYRKDY